MQDLDQGTRVKQIRAWLKPRVAEAVGVSPDAVSWDDSFFSLGLESQPAVTLADEIGRWLGVPVEPMTLFNHPTINALSEHLETLTPRSIGG